MEHVDQLRLQITSVARAALLVEVVFEGSGKHGLYPRERTGDRAPEGKARPFMVSLQASG